MINSNLETAYSKEASKFSLPGKLLRMLFRSIFLIFFILPGQKNVFSQPGIQVNIGELLKKERQHPYLLFNEEEKKEIISRIESSRELSELFEKIRWEGRKYFFAPLQETPPEKNIHTRFYGEDKFRRYQEWNMEGALTLAFLYQLTANEEYAQKAFEYANLMCNLDSWINRAHYFEIIYSRVWPYNVNDDQVVFSYDITASNYAQQMAIVYDWLYPALNSYQRDRIRGTLLEKAITRVRGNYDYHWWAKAYKCNWSAICHAGLGVIALSLLNEDPQLTDVVEESYNGIWNVFNNLDETGGWQEGRGYWAYALNHSVFFMDALKRMTGEKVNLFKHPKVIQNPCDFALFGMTAGFSDGKSDEVGSSFLINKLVAETGSETAAYYRDRFIETSGEIYDLIWTEPSIKPVEPRVLSKHFTGIDWAILRSDFRSENLTIACKTGMNDDPHHGHLDCGSFFITWMGDAFIGEIDRGSYDEQYFGEMRWEYPKAGSVGHNVISVNGEEQIHAKLKDQPWKEGIGGKITAFNTSNDFDYVIMDPTNAYPKVELENWIRYIILDKQNNMALVVDKINCNKGDEIEVRFHPGVDFSLHGNNIELYNEKAQMQMVSFSSIDCNIVPKRIPIVSLRRDEDFEWHHYFSIQAIADAGDNFIGNAFLTAQTGPASIEFIQKPGRQQILCRLVGRTVLYEIAENSVNRL